MADPSGSLAGAGGLAELLAAAAQWHAAGHRLALATVVSTWGSAPRRAGSMLLIRDDGLFQGSVSGGCVEGAVIAAAMRRMESGSGGGELLEYGVTDQRAWDVGLACGGTIRLLLQMVEPGAFPFALLERIAEAGAAGRAVHIAYDLAAATAREGGQGDFVHRIDPPLRLFLIGAVHISQALAPMAEMLGYRVEIVDPRAAFAASERFPGRAVDGRWPDEALADWRPDAASAVVALSHDPKIDDPGLAAALRSEAFYIAALGSRKNHAGRLERLAAMGFDAATLARVRGPAGLAIGAANPAEIALSIAAQMVAVWRGAAV